MDDSTHNKSAQPIADDVASDGPASLPDDATRASRSSLILNSQALPGSSIESKGDSKVLASTEAGSSLPLSSDSTVHPDHPLAQQRSTTPISVVVSDSQVLPTRPGSSVTRSIEMSGIPEASTEEKTVISKRPPTTEIPLPIPTTPQSLGVALVGKRLEHYELEEFVGGGGMGAVFRAHDTRLGRTVAVKVLSRDSNDEETIRRFRNEAQSAARLDHPNIARVYYVGEEQGWNFIVFEFIEGTNLRQWVEQRGPLPLDEALRYTLLVARALEHAASRDVVHRDIKPSNVLVTPDGSVKLVDMGLARLHQVESTSEDLTASGVTLGTFDYISPEQARDPRSADVRSDIYSLGCTLYYMLVAQPPFPEGTALQKLLRHNGVDPPDVRQLRPEVPPRVSTLLLRMLAKRPSQRHQTPADLIRDISSIAEQLGYPIVAGETSSPVTLVSSEPSVWVRTAMLAVPAVTVILGLFLVERLFPPQSETNQISLRPAGMSPITPAVGGSKTANGGGGSEEVPAGQDVPSTEDPEEKTSTPSDPELPPGTAASPGEASGVSGSETGATNDQTGSPSTNPQPADDSTGGKPASTGVAGSARPLTGNEVPPLDPATINPKALPSARIPGTSGESVAMAPDRSESSEVGPPSLSGGFEPGDIAAPSEISVDSPQPPISEAPVAIRRVQVVLPGALVEAAPGVLQVDSLAAACRRAAELMVSDIELAFDGPMVERPFEITQAKLAIRAASGRRPEVVFRPELVGLDAQRKMIQLPESTTGQITLDGIQWRLELPPDPSYGWSLFSLRAIPSVTLLDCVITIRDQGPSGLPQHDQVAIFAIDARKADDAMQMETDDTMVTPILLQMDRTMVRGEAVLVAMIEETPFKLVWREGLLATSKRMIESGGTSKAPKWFGGIEVDLENVTVAAAQGLYQLKRRAGAIHHLPLDMKVNHCVLVTSPGIPLFEFSEVAGVEDVRLRYEGEDNRYPREDLVFLRVRPTGGAAVQDYDMKNRNTWSDEHRVDVGVSWRSPPPSDLPSSEHRKSHYEFSSMSMAREGFNSDLLPLIEESPKQPVTPPKVAIPVVPPPSRLDTLMPPLPADRDDAPVPPESIR